MALEQNIGKVSRAAIVQAAAATQDIVAAVGGQKIKVLAIVGSLTADGTITFKSNTTALSGPIDAAGKAVFGIRGTADTPIFRTAAGEAFKMVTTGGGFNGFVVYAVEGE